MAREAEGITAWEGLLGDLENKSGTVAKTSVLCIASQAGC